MTTRGQELLLAVKNADVEAVKSILEGFDDCEPAEKVNLICTAIEENQGEIVELLFNHVDRVIAYEGCESAVIKALETDKEDKEALKLLLKVATSAKVFSEPIFDKVSLSDALELAIFKRKDQFVDVLLDHGANTLDKLITGRNEKTGKLLEMLVEARKDKLVRIQGVDRFISSRIPTSSIYHSLSLAALFGGPKILQLILNHEADVPEDLIIFHFENPFDSVNDFDISLLDMKKSIFSQDIELNSMNVQELKKMYQILLAHMVFMLAKGMIVKKRCLKRIVGKGFKEIRKFKQECEKEIDLMREERIENTTGTLFDICTTDNLSKLAAFAKNENIIEFMKSGAFGEKYPIYHGKMRWVLQQGFKRNFLLQRVCNFFRTLSTTTKDKELAQLPATCVKSIFEFLTNQDLTNLRDAYY